MSVILSSCFLCIYVYLLFKACPWGWRVDPERDWKCLRCNEDLKFYDWLFLFAIGPLLTSALNIVCIRAFFWSAAISAARRLATSESRSKRLTVNPNTLYPSYVN